MLANRPFLAWSWHCALPANGFTAHSYIHESNIFTSQIGYSPREASRARRRRSFSACAVLYRTNRARGASKCLKGRPAHKRSGNRRRVSIARLRRGRVARVDGMIELISPCQLPACSPVPSLIARAKDWQERRSLGIRHGRVRRPGGVGSCVLCAGVLCSGALGRRDRCPRILRPLNPFSKILRAYLRPRIMDGLDVLGLLHDPERRPGILRSRCRGILRSLRRSILRDLRRAILNGL